MPRNVPERLAWGAGVLEMQGSPGVERGCRLDGSLPIDRAGDLEPGNLDKHFSLGATHVGGSHETAEIRRFSILSYTQ